MILQVIFIWEVLKISEKKEKAEKPPKTEAPPPTQQTTASIRADPTIPDPEAHRIMLEKYDPKKKVAKDKEGQ